MKDIRHILPPPGIFHCMDKAMYMYSGTLQKRDFLVNINKKAGEVNERTELFS